MQGKNFILNTTICVVSIILLSIIVKSFVDGSIARINNMTKEDIIERYNKGQ